MRSWYKLLILSTCFFYAACHDDTGGGNTNPPATAQPAAIPIINYSVKSYLPHDTSLFTEGFLIHDGKIFESTGSPEEYSDARSLVGIIDPKTGKMDQKGFIYDANNFKKTGEFHFDSREGWGLTTDGINLIMDDSSDALTFLEPATLKPVKKLKVTINGAPRDSIRVK